MALRDRHQTVEQLRADIDSGRTGDKVPGPDPASAPLGTDEEAAGTPLDSDAVARARRIESSGPAVSPERRRGLGFAWVIVAVAAVIAVLVVAAAVARLYPR